jgi:hypothetical protein
MKLPPAARSPFPLRPLNIAQRDIARAVDQMVIGNFLLAQQYLLSAARKARARKDRASLAEIGALNQKIMRQAAKAAA